MNVYGGFGISTEALKELVVLKADCIKAMTVKSYYGGDNEKFKHRDWEKEWERDFKEFSDIGDGFMAHGSFSLIYKDGVLYDLDESGDKGSKVRTDKNLIEVIKRLGKKSWDRFAKLKIVTIPDDVEFTIEEYYGMAHIAEQHRIWS